jgi:hypothetical protein
MNDRWLSFLALQTLLFAVLLTTSGCGKGEYERRVHENMKASRTSVNLGPAITIPGTALTVRLPTSVDATALAFFEGSPDPNGAGKLNPDRLNPPFMTIPGQRVCYEIQVSDSATKQSSPMYWYLGALGPQDPLPDGKPIDQYAVEKMTAAFPNPPPVVDSVDVNGVKWTRVAASGPQNFVMPDGGVHGEFGTFQLLVGDVQGTRVVIAFRVMNSVLELSKGVISGPLVAGSVTAPGAPAAPAAPGAAQ